MNKTAFLNQPVLNLNNIGLTLTRDDFNQKSKTLRYVLIDLVNILISRKEYF